MGNLAPHRARKRFGQNFLQDQGIIRNISRSIHALADEHLVEIGPGKGALTADILPSGCLLDAIELDRDLIVMLQHRFEDKPRFHLHQGDALNIDFSTLQRNKEQLRVVGNLPYNISTPLIFHLLDQHPTDLHLLIIDMYFMLQLEVVNRLTAKPGTKNYGRLSVMTQYYCDIEALLEVPPESFSPPPKVQSAFVRLSPYPQPPHPVNNIATLHAIVRTAFNQRRKTLRNALKEVINGKQLQALNIDPSARPETLRLEQFVTIANNLDTLGG